MKITGLQKMTLLDYPGRIACTVFLQGCNFRCPFCHNSDLLGPEGETAISMEELLSFLETRRRKLDGVCVTGGEPTLHRDLPRLLQTIKDMGFLVKLDTNGTRPQVLKEILDAGLVDYVAMDIKNAPDKYAPTCGLSAMDPAPIEESIRFLLAGKVDFEFRTTVVRELHTAQDIVKIGRWLTELSGGKPIRKLFLQPFVDRDTVVFSGLHAPDSHQMAEFTELLKSFILDVSVRG